MHPGLFLAVHYSAHQRLAPPPELERAVQAARSESESRPASKPARRSGTPWRAWPRPARARS